MLPPKRHKRRTRWTCPRCRQLGRPSVIGRMSYPKGARLLTLTMDGAREVGMTTSGQWIVLCACGETTYFSGARVISTQEAQAA